MARKRKRSQRNKPSKNPRKLRNSVPVIVINLKKRTDRWEKFKKHEKLPFIRDIHRLEALDYPECPIYGCFLSHFEALQYALKKGWKQVMICEDDCDFSGDAPKIWKRMQRELPDSWKFVLGGLSGYGPNREIHELTRKHSDHLAEMYSSYISHDEILNQSDTVFESDDHAYFTGMHCIVLNRIGIHYILSFYYRFMNRYNLRNGCTNPKLLKYASHDAYVTSFTREDCFIVAPFLAYTLPNDHSDIRSNQDTTKDMEEFIYPTESDIVQMLKGNN